MKKCYNKDCVNYNSKHKISRCFVWHDIKNCGNRIEKPKKKKRCEWEFMFSEYNYRHYSTCSSVNRYGMVWDNIQETEHRYCPYCGKKIKYTKDES